jgi:hypothetical protein
MLTALLIPSLFAVVIPVIMKVLLSICVAALFTLEASAKLRSHKQDDRSLQALPIDYCRTYAVQAGGALTFSDNAIHGGDVCAVGALTGSYTLFGGIVNNTLAPTTIKTLGGLLEQGMALIGKAMSAEIGGSTFTNGTYLATDITIAPFTTVTLDGENKANPVFIFQATKTLTAYESTQVILINGATSENILWVVGAAAVTGASSSLKGSILGGAAVTLGARAEVTGCVLAVAAVTFGAGSSVG